MLFSTPLNKSCYKKLTCLSTIVLVSFFSIQSVNAKSGLESHLARAAALLSAQLKAGRFNKALLTARALSNAPKPLNYAASFSEFLCLLFTGRREKLGDDFQELARLVERLAKKQKNWIWEFVAASHLSFHPSRIAILYKNRKIKNSTHIFDAYLGIAVFLGNLNEVRSIQESQRILFGLLDTLEEAALSKAIKKHALQKQIVLSVIQRNQEFLQIMTRHAPIEVGEAAM